MTELYWITRLDSIHTLLAVILTLLCFAFLGLLVGGFMSSDLYEDVNMGKRIWRWLKPVGVGIVVSIAALVLIPTSKDMMMIYGVGGTIDYIKSNDTAKQLPDKVVSALDKYLDSLNKEDEQ